MAAYVIVDVDVRDPGTYEKYKRMVMMSLEAYGGRFLVRGGRTRTLEGGWTPGRLVVLEFASVERATQWWESEEYAEPKRIRQSASTASLIVAEGV